MKKTRLYKKQNKLRDKLVKSLNSKQMFLFHDFVNAYFEYLIELEKNIK